jgi:hypothetical protein
MQDLGQLLLAFERLVRQVLDAPRAQERQEQRARVELGVR